MSGEIENRLKNLNIELPQVRPAVANFLPFVRTGNLLFVSGQVPMTDDGKLLSGSVGTDFTVEEATRITRRTTLALLAVVQKALGGLDNVVRVVKINGSVNAVPGFADQPRGHKRLLGSSGRGLWRKGAPCPRRGRCREPARQCAG